jgi:hypothetical protein
MRISESYIDERWRTVLSGEEGFALEHFGKDAACAPDVDSYIVFLPCEHDLGGSVIACWNVSCHLWVLDAGEPKVANLEKMKNRLRAGGDGANLEVTVLIDEDVAWFLGAGWVGRRGPLIEESLTKSLWTTPAECTYLRPRYSELGEIQGTERDARGFGKGSIGWIVFREAWM